MSGQQQQGGGSLVEISDKERALAGRIDSAITAGIAVGQRGGVRFMDANQVMEFAKTMAVANIGVRKHLRGNPGACLAVCVQAVEWGMSPYAVANKSYLVNDQIAYESQMIQAVILARAPITGRIKFEFSGEGGKLQCRAWARLRDDPDEIVEYISPAFDKIAVKNSPLWKADPEQQFTYYAGRALCRRHFPDVLLGVYAEDEFVNGVPMLDSGAREVPATPAPRSMTARLDQIAAGGSHDAEGSVVDDTPNHDADGVIAQDEEDGRRDAEEGDQAGGEQGQALVEDPDRAKLLHMLRGKANNGGKALQRALGGLTPFQNEILTTNDKTYLQGLAEAADREKVDA